MWAWLLWLALLLLQGQEQLLLLQGPQARA
jgi:hypothetical protein